VTHEMSFAQDAADEIVFLDRGRIIEAAKPDKFSRQPETERARRFLQRFASHSRRPIGGA